MKTNFKLLAIAMGIAFAIACSSIVIMSCNTSPKDKENELENAQEEVVEAQEALEQSKQDSLSDYVTFKAGIELKLDENEKLIAQQKQLLNESKEAQKAENLKELIRLEDKNNRLKEKLRDYQEGPSEKWELFKIEFNKEMDELGKSISTMAERNMKK